MKQFLFALQRAKICEDDLRETFQKMATRYADDYEIARGCGLFAGWAEAHLATLDKLTKSWESSTGIAVAPVEPRLPEIGDRTPGRTMLVDLEDLLVLAQRGRLTWLSLHQAALQLTDESLTSSVYSALAQTEREIGWLEAQLKNAAPQALLVEAHAPTTVK